MQSSDDSPVEQPSLNPTTPRKRKLQSHLNAQLSSAPRPQPSTNDSASPAFKKLKINSGKTGTPAAMSRSMVVGTQLRSIDLTARSTAFEPHRGAKKLIVKNLKTSSPNVDKYYADTWAELDTSITLILNGERPTTPLEKMCRGVEMTCRKGMAKELFEHLKGACKAHMENVILPAIHANLGNGSADATRTVHIYWTIWHKRTVSMPDDHAIIQKIDLVADSSTVNFQLPRSFIPTLVERPTSA